MPLRPSTGTSRRLLLAVALLVTVSLAACSDDDDPEVADPRATSSSAASTDDASSTTSPTGDDPDDPVSSDDPNGTTASTTEAPPGAAGPCSSSVPETHAGLAVEVCQLGAATTEADTVIRLRATDGDARVRNECGSPYVEWGDGSDTPVCEIQCVPSATTTSGPSSIEETYSHHFTEAGAYDVEVTVESNCGEPPGGERQTIRLEVQVV